jgi:hypothetical protein
VHEKEPGCGSIMMVMEGFRVLSAKWVVGGFLLSQSPQSCADAAFSDLRRGVLGLSLKAAGQAMGQ